MGESKKFFSGRTPPPQSVGMGFPGCWVCWLRVVEQVYMSCGSQTLRSLLCPAIVVLCCLAMTIQVWRRIALHPLPTHTLSDEFPLL